MGIVWSWNYRFAMGQFSKLLKRNSPELNPAEFFWLNMKRKTTNKINKAMEELKLKLDQIVKDLITKEFIKSKCSFDYFFYLI